MLTKNEFQNKHVFQFAEFQDLSNAPASTPSFSNRTFSFLSVSNRNNIFEHGILSSDDVANTALGHCGIPLDKHTCDSPQKCLSLS